MTNSTSSRKRDSSSSSFLDERALLWDRADNTINSYVYGTNSSVGQMSVFASDASTVMNSISSTGKDSACRLCGF